MSLKRRPRLSFDQLEDRIVLAASIFAGGGSLTILGDNTGNDIEVVQDAGAGNASKYDVTINGGVTKTFTVTKSLTIVSGSGKDDVTVRFVQDAALSSLAIATNGGNDEVYVDAQSVGPVRLLLGAGAGTLSVTTGAGNDTSNFNSGPLAGTKFQVDGNVQLNGGAGSDSVVVGGGLSSDTVTINGTLVLIQTNDVTLENTAVGKTLAVANAADTVLPNVFRVASTSSAFGFSYSGGTGTDALTIEGPVLGKANISTSNGADTVTMGPGVSALVTGDLRISTGEGNDGVVMDATVIASSTIDLGAGNNSLEMASGTVGGSLTVLAAAGNDTVSIDFGVGIVGGGGNLDMHLGNGDNVVVLGPTFAVGGDASITTGSGADTILIPTPAFALEITRGDLSISTGAGNDLVALGDAITVGDMVTGGNLLLNLGSGNDTATIGTGGLVRGDLVAELGTGADVFTIAVGTDIVGDATVDLGFVAPGPGDGAKDVVTGVTTAAGGPLFVTYLHFNPLAPDFDEIFA